MKKKLTSIIIFLFLLFILKEMLVHSKMIMDTVNLAFNIWLNNVFPSLFPFLIISSLLMEYGFTEVTSELLKSIIQKLFKCKKEAAFVLIISMLSGSPNNAKCLKDLYKEKKIDESDITKILLFTHFSSPLFILGTIATTFLNNYKCAIIVLISHYLGNFIIGFLFRNYHAYNNYEKASLRKALMYLYEKNDKKKNIGLLLSNILLNSLNTLFLVLGIITTFLLLTNIINENITLNPYHQSLLNSVFEMTQGLKYLSNLNISLKLKTILTSIIISFGGLSVHLQIYSILSDIKIKYLPFFFARIMHAFLAGLLTYLFLSI